MDVGGSEAMSLQCRATRPAGVGVLVGIADEAVHVLRCPGNRFSMARRVASELGMKLDFELSTGGETGASLSPPLHPQSLPRAAPLRLKVRLADDRWSLAEQRLPHTGHTCPTKSPRLPLSFFLKSNPSEHCPAEALDAEDVFSVRTSWLAAARGPP
jgi:hypothetical protein